MADPVDMDIHEPDSTPGEGVLSHSTHCASCCRLTPKALCHLHSMGAARLRCERLCCVFGRQRLRPFRGSSTTIVFASRALSCSFPVRRLVAPHTTRSAGSRNLRWHVLLATVRANTRDACSDACASRHCVASAWGGRGCALPFYIACDAQPGHSQQISLCCHRPRPSPWVVAHNNRTPHAGATTTKGPPKVHDLQQDVSLNHPPRSIQHTCACADCCAPQHTIRPPRPDPSQVLPTLFFDLVLRAPDKSDTLERCNLNGTWQKLVDRVAAQTNVDPGLVRLSFDGKRLSGDLTIHDAAKEMGLRSGDVIDVNYQQSGGGDSSPAAKAPQLSVPAMRAAMMQLGHSKAFVNATKGVAAMRALYADTIAAGLAPAEDVNFQQSGGGGSSPRSPSPSPLRTPESDEEERVEDESERRVKRKRRKRKRRARRRRRVSERGERERGEDDGSSPRSDFLLQIRE